MNTVVSVIQNGLFYQSVNILGGWLPDMNIFALIKIKRGTAFATVTDSGARQAAVSSIQSIIRTVLPALCCSFFISGPAHGQSDGVEAPPAPALVKPSPVILSSGAFQGVWRDEKGVSGGLTAELEIDGESIQGKLSIGGVDKYTGDKIRGKIFENDDGTLGIEFKTRDGKWKSKGIFDGQLLMGTYSYEYADRRGKKFVKGEWAAQGVPDT